MKTNFRKNASASVCLALGLTLSTLACATEISFGDGKGTASVSELRSELKTAPAQVRGGLSATQMARYIENYLVDKRLLDAALASGIAEREDVKLRLAKARRDVLIREFLDDEIAKENASLPALDALAKERYDSTRDTFKRPESMRVAHILLKVNEEFPEMTDAMVKEKALKLLAQIRGGGDFGQLAKKHSEDKANAGEGGELSGWQERGRLVPPFEKAAYALQPGQVSDVVRTRFGYHIIKLLEYRPARIASFEEVKDDVLNKVRNELVSQKRGAFMKQFMGETPIKVDPEMLAILKKP